MLRIEPCDSSMGKTEKSATIRMAFVAQNMPKELQKTCSIPNRVLMAFCS